MKIYNWDDVENITGVSKHRVIYAIQRGRLGGFPMVKGAYIFTHQDLENIGRYFEGRKPWQRQPKQQT